MCCHNSLNRPLGVQWRHWRTLNNSSFKDVGTSSKEHETDWIEAEATCVHSITDLLSKNTETHSSKSKRRRGWKKKTKIPYNNSTFYRHYHNPKVRDSNHTDTK